MKANGRLKNQFVRKIKDSHKRFKEKPSDHQYLLRDLITRISTDFINLPLDKIDQGIHSALKSTGEFAGVDRSYLFLLSEDGGRFINTHEWSTKEVESQKHKIQDAPIESFAWSMKKIHNLEMIHIPSVAHLPAEAEAEKMELLAHGIKSLVSVPIVFGGKCIGMLGFDSIKTEREWPEEILSLLKIMGNMISNLLDRKQKEEALNDREEKYRNVVENSSDGICIVQDDHVKFVNQQSINLIGYSAEELTDTPFINYIHPDELQMVISKYMSFMCREMDHLKFETVLVHKNGNDVTVEMNVSPTSYNGNRAALVFIRNMRERKLAEQKIRKSEARLKAAQKIGKIGVWELDVKSREIFWSDQVFQLFERDPVIGPPNYQEHLSYFFPKDIKHFRDCIQKAIKTGNKITMDCSLRLPSGQSVYYENIINPIRDQNGSVLNVIGTVQDMTEYKNAEESLRKSEQRYRDLVENINESIYSLDKKGEMTYISPAVKSLLGYTPSEIIGRSFTEFIHPEDLPNCVKNFQKALMNRNVSGEYRVLSKSGEIRWIHTNTKPVFMEKQIIGIHGILSDISDQKKAEQALRKSEEKYRLMSENIPVAVYSAQPDEYFKTFFVTGKIRQLTGYSPKQFKDDPRLFSRIIHPDDMDYVCNRMKEHYKNRSKRQIHLEYRIIKRDDQIKWVKDRATCILDKDEKTFRINGFLEDITTQKNAEKALQDSEKKFKALAENSPNMIFMHKRGSIVYVNKRCEEIMGYKKGEFYSSGFDFQCLVAPEDRQIVMQNLKKHMKGQEVPPVEYTILTKAGRRIEAILTTRLLDYENERAILGIITDITEQKKFEKELHLAKCNLEYLIQSVPSVIYRCENSGKYIPTYISDNLFRVLGYTPKEFLSDPKFWQKHIHPEDVSGILKNLEDISIKDTIIQEYRFLHKNGTYRWLSDDCRLIYDQKGNPVEIVGSFIDITDKKYLEEQFLQSQKMEAVGRLAGGIAHDFNNLLQSIIGYCDLILLDHKAGCNPGLYEKDIEQIKKAGHRAASLTRQLLAFSRKQELKPVFINLNMVISELTKMLRRLIGEDITLKTILDPELKTVKADQTQIEQVIMNLAVNARDAMTDGGRLKIQTQNVILEEKDSSHVSDARPGEFICLCVEDSGTGIEKEVMKHIFEPFFSTKKKGEGTGLGLPTVYGIIKQHEGWIDIDSQTGKGTIFKIYLPCYSLKLEDQASEDIPISDLKGNGERLLLVEDEAGVRQFTKRALQNAGYQVFEASCVQEGLEIIKREKGRFDLLLSDVVLPDQSGLILMHQIRMMNPSIRIIMCSGYTDQKSQWELIHTQGIHFIQKPYPLLDLLQCIKTSLQACLVK
ncbi:MAG: PAS domain S-box protein [bacterium]